MEKNLKKDPIPKLIAQIAIPTCIGSLFSILYSIVDSWYAAQIGTAALAGLSLSFPVFFLFIALSMGFSSGATALIGQALGKGSKTQASLLHWQLISLGLLLSLCIAIIGLSFGRDIFIFLGATGDYLNAADDYMMVFFICSPIMILGPLINSALTAQGLTNIYRNALVVAFFANLILNPWFIYGGFGLPPMGVKGIALATVISQAGTVFYLYYHVYKTGITRSLRIKKLKPNLKKWREHIAQGIPSVLNMASIGIFFFAANHYINLFGPEAVAAYGIGLRIEQLVLVPSMAIHQAALTLVANNAGAQLWQRVHTIWHYTLISLGSLLCLGMVILLLFGEPMMRAFTDDPKVISVGVGYLAIEAFTLVAYSFIHGNGAILQGLKKPKIVMWVGITRTLIFPLPLLPLLITYFGFGLESIWWMILIMSWLSGLFLLYYTRKILKQIDNDPSSIIKDNISHHS